MIQRLQGVHISQVPALIVVDLSMAALVGLGTGKCEREISRMNEQIRFPFLWDRNIYIYIYSISLWTHPEIEFVGISSTLAHLEGFFKNI